ncbi:176_t:CDS:2 [Diversispora eburnea]|uniref:176_t:CDS:1 n=1 Tax=Diversispora eburnea TaxID=1213867 RepID=A0A9N9C016_9GLOM|nr:176_t:CDS:2 [Diversispora eburnea]
MEAIADNLARSDYEIICLQEVWVYDNYELIRNKIKKRFPYARFYHSGVLGGGLAIFSRYPIVETNFHPYRLNGRPIQVNHGDWYVGKGIASAVVDHPVAGLIEIFNTHTHAGYGSKATDVYLGHRISQGWDASNLMKISASRGRNVIAVNTLVYKLITQNGQMTDAWQSQHSSTPGSDSTTSITQPQGGLSGTDPNSAIVQKGVTSNSPINTWTKRSRKQSARDLGQRIDYIFYRKTSRFWCSGSRVVFVEKIPELNCSYSDHFGVEATFALVGRDKNSVIPLSVWEQVPYTLRELDSRTLKNIIDYFNKDLINSQRTSRLQLLLFWFSLLLVIFLIAIELLIAIGTISAKAWISIIIIVVIGPLAVFGSIIGSIGFLSGNTEQNVLSQLIEEVKTFNDGKKILESRESKTSSEGFSDSSQRSSARLE